VSGDGSQLFVRTRAEVVAIATSDGSISSRKAADQAEIATAPDAQAYLIDAVGGTLTTLDGNGITRDLPSAQGHDSIVEDVVSTPDGRQLYLLREGASNESSQDRVEVVDTATGRITRTIRLGPAEYHIPTTRLSPDGNQLYIAPFNEPSVDIFDITDHK